MPWTSITLEMDPAAAEAFSEALMEAGADSVSLETAGAQMRLDALAPAGGDAAALVDRAAGLLGIVPPAFRSGRVEDDDWVRRSQSQFGPIRVSDALWIVPSWHEPPAGAKTVVRLDPGLAFGTGSHVSTRLILQRLEPVLAPNAAGLRVLDYGCGSGILAIVAARLGAKAVAAVDIDPQALEATAANAAANGVRVAVFPPEQLPEETHDVVLANILAGPLVALEPVLAERTRRGGCVLLSGILESQAAGVARAYAADFDASVAVVDEGWALVEGIRR